MKLIKKIAAIMFAFMMVFSLSTNVKAQTDASGNYDDGNGKITISNAVIGQNYTIYRMLKLESYSGENYSYKLEAGWEDFINGTGADYLTEDNNGYITFNPDKDTDTDMRLFAQKALAFAKTTHLATDPTFNKTATSNTVNFGDLPLGYYVVGSTVGSLCELTTTDKEVSIQDKNEQPTVDKKIVDTYHHDTLVTNNSADIGEGVTFKTTIYIKPGAKNYVLHDKMDSHLRFVQIAGVYDNNGKNYALSNDFVYKTTGLADDDCTFELSFTDNFYTSNKDDIDSGNLNEIYIYYYANVNDDAIVNHAMNNTAKLTYGENNDMESNPSTTTTKTFGIPLFKCTKYNTALAGAEFILTTTKNDDTTALKFTEKNGKYRFDSNGEPRLVSSDNGYFDIEGIKAGTYYLKETKAPTGYNLLKEPKTVEIAEDGKIKVDNKTVERVDVVNNTGTILPHTGGMGTTLIYLIGGALVLGSGFVLANKKRAKAK